MERCLEIVDLIAHEWRCESARPVMCNRFRQHAPGRLATGTFDFARTTENPIDHGAFVAKETLKRLVHVIELPGTYDSPPDFRLIGADRYGIAGFIEHSNARCNAIDEG